MKPETKIELQHSLGPSGATHTRSMRRRPLADLAYPAAGSDQVAVLFNHRAHRNTGLAGNNSSTRIWHAAPRSPGELDRTLANFAHQKVDTIIIDGGDGTVRDVLSRIDRHYRDGLPRFAVLPSGKTNALAGDLGLRRRWPMGDVLSTLHRWKTVRRSPIDIRYGSESEVRLRGFVFGTGAFVRATSLAQSVHRAGAFNGMAVGLALAGALGRTLLGAADDRWRQGDEVLIELDGRAIRRDFFLLLGSTLERMPAGLRPFGASRGGLKLLGVDAPPRHPLLCAAALAMGSEAKWLNTLGCRRADTNSLRLRIDSEIVLDGERFAGGDLTISTGPGIDFLVPE